MKKTIVLTYLLIIIVVVACTAAPRAVETSIPLKTASPIVTITPRPSKISYTPTLSAVPTEETDVPDKQILISYTVYSDGGGELFYCLQDIGHPIFLLYEDGQLIFLRNGRFLESSLTSREIDSLLTDIENTGLFNITESSGWAILFVKGNSYNFPSSAYPAGAIQQTMNILNQLQPQTTAPYVPESLFLWIYPITSVQSIEEGLPKPVPAIRNWSPDLPRLSEFGEGFINISGDNLPMVMAQFDGFPDYEIFQEGSSLYLTAICAHLP